MAQQSAKLFNKALETLWSLAEAAILAKVSIYVMMDYVNREKIQPPFLTDVEMEEELKWAKKLFEEMNQ